MFYRTQQATGEKQSATGEKQSATGEKQQPATGDESGDSKPQRTLDDDELGDIEAEYYSGQSRLL